MAFSTGKMKDRITILNRAETTASDWGRDASGVSWTQTGPLWAWVDWAKGKAALNAGALDAYAVKHVRMRYTDDVNCRSRVQFNGDTYQILAETFHSDYQENTIQFDMQLLVNEE